MASILRRNPDGEVSLAITDNNHRRTIVYDPSCKVFRVKLPLRVDATSTWELVLSKQDVLDLYALLGGHS